jgi:hypothetical protein
MYHSRSKRLKCPINLRDVTHAEMYVPGLSVMPAVPPAGAGLFAEGVPGDDLLRVNTTQRTYDHHSKLKRAADTPLGGLRIFPSSTATGGAQEVWERRNVCFPGEIS